MEKYLIGELSKKTGCNIETIRYYEKIGLLPAPPRSVGGRRIYDFDHLKRLHFICQSRKLGFSIKDIKTFLGFVDNKDYSCQEVFEITHRHLEDIREKIASLKKLEKMLKKMSAQCKRGSHPDCPIIEGLFES